MNTELFIVRRLIGSRKEGRSFSRSIVGIAMFGIAMSLAVMIVAVAIVTGFKKEISNKVTGFGAHIQILNMDSNLSYETAPVPSGLESVKQIREIEGIKNVQPFAIKAGIIKTGEEIHGALLKGIDKSFDWTFIEEHLSEGELFHVNDTVRTNDVVLSGSTARLLNLGVGDRFTMYFIQDPPRARTFTISGIYNTSLEQFDMLYIFADIKQVQRLNNWDMGEVSGYEVLIEKMEDLHELSRKVKEQVGLDFLEDGSRLRVETIEQKYAQIFDWLKLQDMNVIVLVILMVVVAGFNMISGLLILILERTNMIGILKALGTNNISVRKIFMYQSAFLTLVGLFWGNLFGLGICLAQKYLNLMPLDPSSYYLDTVPINLNLLHLLMLNLGTMVITFLFLLIPSMIIARISPEKSIRFN
ncbi:MAG: FtsX-like permease family protein [Bacteroidales bacterium]|nr:FtsX-like permease family protein [Bacteroidales bacterium]